MDTSSNDTSRLRDDLPTEVRDLNITADVSRGEADAPIGTAVVTDQAGDDRVTVHTFVSLIDGAIVVDAHTHVPDQHVRIALNDGQIFETPDSGETENSTVALKRLVATHFGGDWAALLTRAGQLGEVAVAHLDRDWFARSLTDYHHDRLGHIQGLTDDLWNRMTLWLEDYDERINQDRTDDDFLRYLLDKVADEQLGPVAEAT